MARPARPVQPWTGSWLRPAVSRGRSQGFKTTTAHREPTVAAIQETVDGYAGLDREVRTYLQQTLSLPPTSASDGLTVRVFGEDLDVLRVEAEKVRQGPAGRAGGA